MNDISFDKDGFLTDYRCWTPELAQHLAINEHIQWSLHQQTIVNYLRIFYQTYELSPTMKVFLNYLQQQVGYASYSSLQLMDDFPGRGSPMKRLCKIAGLPKPTNCF